MGFSARIIRAISAIALAGSFAACVFVDRYSYVALESPDAQVISTAIIEVERHVGAKGPIPASYSLEQGNYLITFQRDPSDTQGGLTISASVPDGASPVLVVSEAPLAEPGYGACRAYYRDSESGHSLYFFDQCPTSLERTSALPNDALQLPWHSALQSTSGRVWH